MPLPHAPLPPPPPLAGVLTASCFLDTPFGDEEPRELLGVAAADPADADADVDVVVSGELSARRYGSRDRQWEGIFLEWCWSMAASMTSRVRAAEGEEGEEGEDSEGSAQACSSAHPRPVRSASTSSCCSCCSCCSSCASPSWSGSAGSVTRSSLSVTQTPGTSTVTCAATWKPACSVRRTRHMVLFGW